MKSLIGYEYVSQKCNGNLDECNKLRSEIGDCVRSLYNNSKKIGYFGKTMKTRNNLVEQGLDDQDITALLEIVDNTFPFLYVLITYNPDSVGETEILDIETKFNLNRTRQVN